MIRKALTPTESTVFAELVQQVQTAPPAGTVYSREREGTQYYYAKIPVGITRIDTFIGKVGDEKAEAKVAELKAGMELAKSRRGLIAMLKRAGLASPPRVLGATLDAIAHAGLFREGAVLVGTAAYLTTEPLVGHLLPAPTLMTGDLDLATADLALQSESSESFETILKRADPTFNPVLQINPRQPASRFRTDNGFLVDLVTPTRRREDKTPMPMDQLQAGAAPLQYMDWLIADPVQTVALWGSGVAINVPQPARFAVHKLILAQKRDAGARLKRQKDLLQAKALIQALQAQDPFAVADALLDAAMRGRKGWHEPIQRSLTELQLIDILDQLHAEIDDVENAVLP
jgi:hypothetical protein